MGPGESIQAVVWVVGIVLAVSVAIFVEGCGQLGGFTYGITGFDVLMAGPKLSSTPPVPHYRKGRGEPIGVQ